MWFGGFGVVGCLVGLLGGWVVFWLLGCWAWVAGLLCVLVVGLLGCWVFGLLGFWVAGLLGVPTKAEQSKNIKGKKTNPTTHNQIDMARRNARSD